MKRRSFILGALAVGAALRERGIDPALARDIVLPELVLPEGFEPLHLLLAASPWMRVRVGEVSLVLGPAEHVFDGPFLTIVGVSRPLQRPEAHHIVPSGGMLSSWACRAGSLR
jgi:hypothetical protein